LKQTTFRHLHITAISIICSFEFALFLKKHTDLSLPKYALGIAYVFAVEAAAEEDCFFNLFGQGVNQFSIPGGQFNVKSIRQACFACAKGNKDCVGDSQSELMWPQLAAEDAGAGEYALGGKH
jgi:hypothetical protein